MRRFLMVPILALMLVISTSVAQALITPVKVLVEPALQWFPASDGTYLAYTTNTIEQPNTAYAKVTRLSTGATVRINAAGTEGFTGAFDPASDKVIYQQANFKKGLSDLYFWDLSSRSRSKVPGVNSGLWEFGPRISSTFVTFFREFKSNGVWYTGVYLSRRSNGRLTRLAFQKSSKTSWTNGNVGDRYATWSWCNDETCYAFVYDAQTRELKKIPSKNGRPQYGPAVEERSGQVFFVRSGFGCGAEVFVYSAPAAHPGADPEKVVDLPDGIDIGTLSPAANDSGAVDLVFDWIDCKERKRDIYALRSVTPASPT
jgi:hypothetical protein